MGALRIDGSTGGLPYSRIQYPRFQLSAVGLAPKKDRNLTEVNGS